MNREIDLKMNFFKDWTRILKEELINYGFNLDSNNTPREICIMYFNYKKRLINPTSREILFSKKFSCPDNSKDGLENIKKKVRNGEDLLPYLSKNINNLNYDDDMLNDWGVYHLHLGKEIKDSGFIERTGSLLFARFDNDFAYFIDVYEHGDWTKKEIVERIHDNWPTSIEDYQLKGVTGLSQKCNDNERKMFREAGLSTLIEVESGIVYAPIGGGYVTAGSSIEVLMECDRYAYKLKTYEESIKNNIDKIISEVCESGKEINESLHFTLKFEESDIIALETNTQIRVKLDEVERN